MPKLKLLVLDGNCRTGGNGFRNKGAGTNDAARADHCVAAQDRRIGIDRHIVFNGGMPLLPPETLPAPGRKAAQRHALIDFHTLTDHSGLTNDDARAMVNKEVVSDHRARVNIDTGNTVGMLRHDSGNHRNTQHMKLMGQPIHRNGKQARIGENDLLAAGGSRVTLVSCLQVCLDHRPDSGNGLQKLETQLLALLLRPVCLGTAALQHQSDLLAEVEDHILDQHGKIVLHIVNIIILIPGIARIHDPAELCDHVDHHILIRMPLEIDLINIPSVSVVLQDRIHNRFDPLFDRMHGDHLLTVFLVYTIPGK